MRLVLRRLLWLGPTLLAITLVTFGVLSSALPADPELAELPLFFNPEPGAVERLASEAFQQIVSADGQQPEAERTLATLGGAALPYVLPALQAQSPEGRARVVRALRPVAARMGLDIADRKTDERRDPSREVLAWTRFWEEHAIDYRPSVARRAVLRLAQRSTQLRDTEVRQLDTYALDELIAQMPPDGTSDIERTRRLAQLAADITGQVGLVLPAEAELLQAEALASAWQDWWARRRSRYETYTGTERVAAMLRDTRYGSWAAQAVRRKLGLLRGGRPVWDVLREGASVTLPLFACGLLGAWLGAAAAGIVRSFGARRWTRWLDVGAVAGSGLPALLLAVLAVRWLGSAASSLWLAGLLMLVAGAPLAVIAGSSSAAGSSAGFVRTLAALGVSRWRAGLATLRLSSARLVVLLGAHLSNLLTLTCVVEYVLGLGGLGSETIAALREPDLNWLMAITVGAALFAGLWHVFGEWLASLLDPRWVTAASAAGEPN
jgi:ABC-type dipeptide/oligopeptide/nickel transport system permease component